MFSMCFCNNTKSTITTAFMFNSEKTNIMKCMDQSCAMG